MNTTDFEIIISSFYNRLEGISAADAAKRPGSSWSIIQITGHLVDSAGNFHQRLVRLQEGNLGNFPTYNGSIWVENQNYQTADWSTVRQLWHLFNLHLLHVIRNIPDSSLANEWELEEGLGADLEWLIHDYYQHMEHHIRKLEGKIV